MNLAVAGDFRSAYSPVTRWYAGSTMHKDVVFPVVEDVETGAATILP
jgi:hypothetical protein